MAQKMSKKASTAVVRKTAEEQKAKKKAQRTSKVATSTTVNTGKKGAKAKSNLPQAKKSK